MNLNPEIISDVQQVAKCLGRSTLSRSEYAQHARFSLYQIYDGGTSWEDYCLAAGVETKRIEEVPDEVYFCRLVHAIEKLGRLPKSTERKMFGLNFSKRRFPTLSAFIKAANEKGVVEAPEVELEIIPSKPQPRVNPPTVAFDDRPASGVRPIPPIPANSPRTRWERIDVPGFPYAPQDESGTIALFAILCSRGEIQWDILDLNSGKGIDCICWDHTANKELRVEVKHTLARASWNHPIDELDYVVCWENRWPDFEKPVLSLRDLMRVAEERG